MLRWNRIRFLGEALVVLALLAAANVFWTVPHLSPVVEGVTLRPFDMRLGRYDTADARIYLRALGPEGISFYRNVQLTLDLFLPAAIFTAAALAARAFYARPVRRAVICLAIAAVGADYLENAALAHMLEMGPAELSSGIVGPASVLTRIKLVLYLLTALALLPGALMSAGEAFDKWRQS
ncbi:hypothetical protein ACX9MO_11665 [Pseudooceanicola sp. 502str34]